ncbi:MAG: hypothetical protein HRT87_00800 [Legionellales bacterium]|nr:hypothetical protein [Legionellales bacterium]
MVIAIQITWSTNENGQNVPFLPKKRFHLEGPTPLLGKTLVAAGLARKSPW